LVVLAASTTIAAEVNTTTGTNARKPNATDIVEHNFDPEAVADAVVVYNPMVRHALDKMEPFERVLAGRVETQEKGRDAHNPRVIVHNASTMIAPLEAGVPVRIYLKRFPDRDAYYPIAIFPVSKGAQ
jgi:hypothetical protein